jgi:hypothetical protein
MIDYDYDVCVQCVYGEGHIEHIEACLIPALQSASNLTIQFRTMNYDPASRHRLESGWRFGIRVEDVANVAHGKTGFAENHNALFSHENPRKYFVIINPDCIPHEKSIDFLIRRMNEGGAKVGIVEGRQWPFEHPKEYDLRTNYTNWASGAFQLIDSKFYDSIGGMDPVYFLYMEDVDLSWQAWLNGYSVLYEPGSVTTHFSGGPFYQSDLVSAEQFFGLRNFIIISRKFFGMDGEDRAIELLRRHHDHLLADQVISEYKFKFSNAISNRYSRMSHEKVKIYDVGLFHKLRSL